MNLAMASKELDQAMLHLIRAAREIPTDSKAVDNVLLARGAVKESREIVNTLDDDVPKHTPHTLREMIDALGDDIDWRFARDLITILYRIEQELRYRILAPPITVPPLQPQPYILSPFPISRTSDPMPDVKIWCENRTRYGAESNDATGTSWGIGSTPETPRS